MAEEIASEIEEILKEKQLIKGGTPYLESYVNEVMVNTQESLSFQVT